METIIIDPKNIVYKHIEFFFSKDDLKSMMTIKPLSYEPWLDTLYNVYSSKPENDGTFHYNIMHTPEYEKIQKLIKEIEDITKGNVPEYENKTDDDKKNKINQIFDEIKNETTKLYYYDEIYMYAHYVFNNIRKSGVIQLGGGISLEEFKQKIREKIRLMDL